MTSKITRIQQKNRAAILDAALELFSSQGFRGTTVDQIASRAGMSKPNLLYYFPSKDAMHQTLLAQLLDAWLDPLRDMDPNGNPLEEILAYTGRKMQMSRDFPRESRLFAYEIIQGAPRIKDILSNDLKPLVDQKAAVLQSWMDQGRIASIHPHHLIFSIWAITQHYADFDAQVRAVLDVDDPFETAPSFIETLLRRLLDPEGA